MGSFEVGKEYLLAESCMEHGIIFTAGTWVYVNEITDDYIMVEADLPNGQTMQFEVQPTDLQED